MELLPQTGVFQPVHHGQHMNSSLANQLSTTPQQNVMVPTIKPTVMVNPYEAGANNYMPQKFCFQPPSRPQVPVETFPPAFISQLVDKQHHYQQMTNNSSFNSYGPQQAEAYHNFLIPTMPNPQMQAVSEYQSPRSSTPHQPFNWFTQGLGNESQESPHTSTHAPRCTNLVYDPAFEEMGLPIDPHLRLFLSKDPSTHPSYTKSSCSGPALTEPTHTEIPPPQASLAPDHASWMDLYAQINSLGTRMEELVVVSDTRFYSMKNRMDQYQAGFTSQFEYL
ncbi:uncharacterized protein LOC104879149 [Vitis vinifera]|uniref:uncharacterized protein LOC104879149 n=1 Tax=Vitis vinifera TaxID=29760 RepID=UPI002882E8A9|nr:uncharacterized protein LOC104879149 [Vitis vinifera]